MKTTVRFLLALASLGTALSAAPARAADAPAWTWYEVDNGRVRLNLYVFWSNNCPHCGKALAFLDGVQKKHDWLKVRAHEIGGDPAGRDLYRAMAESLHKPAGQVPAFIYCKQLEVGFDSDATTGARLERNLTRYRDALQKQLDDRARPKDAPGLAALPPETLLALSLTALTGPPAGEETPLELELPPDLAEAATVQVPVWGEVGAGEVSLPALTVVMAGLDAFNPCAFFVLMILLSLMLRSRSRRHMLLVGGVFVFFSGLMYFLFMAAWLNLFVLIGHIRAITVAAGLVAVAAALVNVKDYFWFKKGFSLSIPESAKPGLFRRMNRLIESASLPSVLVGTAALAAAANLYELLCTAGFPMVYTRVLTLRELPATTYYLYLVLYNVIYVVPLAVIVTVFALTLAAHKLTEYEGRVLKLLSGLMMLVLGVVLLARPESLGSVGGALAAVAIALGVTSMIVGGDGMLRRWRNRPGLALPRSRRPAA